MNSTIWWVWVGGFFQVTPSNFPLFVSFKGILSKFSYVKPNPYYRLFCELGVLCYLTYRNLWRWFFEEVIHNFHYHSHSALTGNHSCITATIISSSTSTLAFHCAHASSISWFHLWGGSLNCSCSLYDQYRNTSYPLSFLQWSTLPLLGILGSTSQSLP